MEILFNKNGSIKYFIPFEYVQQGNDGVDKVKMAIEGLDYTEWNAIANFKLPNGDITSIVIGQDTDQHCWVDNVYGWCFYLTNSQTQYAGVVEMSISFINLNKTLFTYRTNIIVNKTPFNPDEVNITYSEYQSLVRALNDKLGNRTSIHSLTNFSYAKAKGNNEFDKLLSYVIVEASETDHFAYGYPSGYITYRNKKKLTEKSPQDLIHQLKRYNNVSVPSKHITILDLLEPNYTALEEEYNITKDDLLNIPCYPLINYEGFYGLVYKTFEEYGYIFSNSGFCFEINIPYSDLKGEEENRIGLLIGNAKVNSVKEESGPYYPLFARKKIYVTDYYERYNIKEGNLEPGQERSISLYCKNVKACFYIKLYAMQSRRDSTKSVIVVRFIDLFKPNPKLPR